MTDETPTAADRPIVVGVDGSVFSRAALAWAIAEGHRWDAPVVAVMAWHVDAFAGATNPQVTGVAMHPRQSPKAVFQRFLDDTVRAVLARTGGPAPDAVLLAGLAADVLVERSRHARLLVLGSHGHGRLRGSVIGSVADHCVRTASCPVLIIPSRLVDEQAQPLVSIPAAALPDRYGYGPL